MAQVRKGRGKGPPPAAPAAAPQPPPAAPKKAPAGAPRLAKLSRGQGRRAPRTFREFAGGIILFSGLSVGGAAWLAGNLFDMHEAAYAGADRLATGLGLKVNLDVRGVDPVRREEVRRAAMPEGRSSILAASPDALKARIERLEWVGGARVERLWPNTLRFTIERRREMAVWREKGRTIALDVAGEPIHGATEAENASLPLLTGAGAGIAARPILAALDQMPHLREATESLERVGGRRWNLHAKSGAVVRLPEGDAVAAMAQVESLQTSYKILDGRYRSLDLTAHGRLAVQPSAAAPGAGA
jgi:cell division protein FtsQ